jgi:hypothetical protein
MENNIEYCVCGHERKLHSELNCTYKQPSIVIKGYEWPCTCTKFVPHDAKHKHPVPICWICGDRRKKISEIKMQKWLNRQIEFRNNTCLYNDSIIYQGRIVSIAKQHNLNSNIFAIVAITHKRQLGTKCIQNNRNSLDCKTIITGQKYPYKNIEKTIYHLVELSGHWNLPLSGHWKSQGIIRQGDVFDKNWNYYSSLPS